MRHLLPTILLALLLSGQAVAQEPRSTDLPGADPRRPAFRPDIPPPLPTPLSPRPDDSRLWQYRGDLLSRQREIEQSPDRLQPGRQDELRSLNSEINRMNNQLFR
jgi:hypothetical protein